MYQITIRRSQPTFIVQRVDSTIQIITSGRRGLPGQGIIPGGLTGEVLAKRSDADFDMEWSSAGAGDMLSSIYDPQSIQLDAFARSNHTGTQPASTISDFQLTVSSNADVSANTAARHTHTNKSVLDDITAAFTTEQATKLSGIATGAEVNVQSNWTESNSSSDAFIQNKPVLGALAAKDTIDIADINATGTPGETTYLRGDGAWETTPSGGSTEWGDITGDIVDQTDLQNALDDKYDADNPSGFTNNTGTVTSVGAGNGLNFTSITASGDVTLGTPSNITLASANEVTTNSHTHAFAPGGTDSQYIRGDGVLASFPSIPQGTVTQIIAGTGLSGGTITSSGTIDLSSGTLASLGLADSAVQPQDSVTDLYMATGRILGRTTASTGAVQEITIGSGLTLADGSLSADAPTPFNLTITDGDESVSNINTINLVGATVTDDDDGEVTITVTATGSGDVIGPDTATDNAIARFDSETGKIIQNSVVTIADDTGNVAGVGTLNTHTIPGGTGTLALTSDLSSYLPLAGGTMSGTITTSATLFARSNSNSSGIDIFGGNADSAGAGITLFGGTHSTNPNQGRLRAGSAEIARWNADGVVINEDGADRDTRIEGDSVENLFLVDASTDRVAIGTSHPTHLFSVAGAFGLIGSTSGAVSLTAPAEAGSQDYTLPTGFPAEDGYVLSSTEAGVMSWVAQSGGGSPGGSNTQLQYNNEGVFGGISGAITNGTVVTLTDPIIDNINDVNGNELLIFSGQSSAINELTLLNAATGSSPTLRSTGGDDNVGLFIEPKGTSATVVNLNHAGATPSFEVRQAGDGDSALRFRVGPDTASFAVGIDNSDSDRFVISRATNGTAVLGTNNVFTISTSGGTRLLAGFATAPTDGDANLAVASSNALVGSLSDSAFQLLSSSVSIRIWERGSAGGTITANTAYVSHLIGTQTATEASSGTHPLVTQFALKPLTLTNGTAATTNGATFYVEGPATGTATITNNYAMWVDSGVSRFDGGLLVDGASVFNEAGGDFDFRVESDTFTNAFFLDGETGVPQFEAIAAEVSEVYMVTVDENGLLSSEEIPACEAIIEGTGSDQSSQINTALLNNTYVKLVGDIVIDSPIIIPSNTTLDATGAIVTLTAHSGDDGVNAVQNQAVSLSRRIIDGVITNGDNTFTSDTADFTVGDEGSPIRIYYDYDETSEKIEWLDTTIDSVTNGTTVELTDAPTKTMTARYVHIGDRDENVTLIGGKWIREAPNGAGGENGWNSNHFRFRHIDGLRVRHIEMNTGFASNSKYGVNAGDCYDFIIEDIYFEHTHSDAVHINGPALWGTIRDISSHGSGDDIVSLTGGDFRNEMQWMGDTLGSITDMLVENVFSEPSYNNSNGTQIGGISRGVLLLAGQDGNSDPYWIDRISVRDVDVQLENYPVFIGGDDQDSYTDGGSWGRIFVENVTNNNDNAPGAAIRVVAGATVKHLEVRSAFVTNEAIHLWVESGATVDDLYVLGMSSDSIAIDGTATNMTVAYNFAVLDREQFFTRTQHFHDNAGSEAVKADHLRIYPKSIGGSASLFLDNNNDQTWEFFSNNGGSFGVFDQDNSKQPFTINPDTNTDTLVLDPFFTKIRSNLVVNEDGSDYDTRFEGDTDPNAFFLDASTDLVSFGTGYSGRNLPRVTSTASASSLTPTKATTDRYIYTALAANFTLNNPSVMEIGEILVLQITDDSTPRTLDWGTDYVGIDGQALASVTISGKTMEFILSKVASSKILVSYVVEG